MKKAVVLSLDTDLDELKSLLDTLTITVLKEFVQKMKRPHKTSFLGPGKIDEVQEEIEGTEFDLVVVNGILRPAQHHFLEMKFQKECIDRPGVILRIFANHAHSPEAIAQVTLAKLRYEQPFLREWIHKAKSGDRPGFLAGGAYATDVYYEHARTHARKIEQSLSDLAERRETTRFKRREKGYLLVSLAGHTNVGKSALLNALSGSQVEVDCRMFSTLSTTTRRLPGSESRVLLTDTVGFLRDLPPDLIDAFNSTLEEIFQADLVLLVFDLGEDEELMREKLHSSLNILLPEVDSNKLVLVGNKSDLLLDASKERIESIVRSQFPGHSPLLVSAKTGAGLNELRQRILEAQEFSCLIEVSAPHTDEVYSLMSRLRSSAHVQEQSTGPSLRIQIRCKPGDRQKLEAWVRAVGGVIESVHQASRGEDQNGKTIPQEEKGPLSGGAPL
jgi:GTP-binding protein HflX